MFVGLYRLSGGANDALGAAATSFHGKVLRQQQPGLTDVYPNDRSLSTSDIQLDPALFFFLALLSSFSTRRLRCCLTQDPYSLFFRSLATKFPRGANHVDDPHLKRPRRLVRPLEPAVDLGDLSFSSPTFVHWTSSSCHLRHFFRSDRGSICPALSHLTDYKLFPILIPSTTTTTID